MKKYIQRGEQFNRLTAVRRLDRNHWLWLCTCKAVKEIRTYNVTSGKTKSCGCLNKERSKPKKEPEEKKPEPPKKFKYVRPDVYPDCVECGGKFVQTMPDQKSCLFCIRNVHRHGFHQVWE